MTAHAGSPGSGMSPQMAASGLGAAVPGAAVGTGAGGANGSAAGSSPAPSGNAGSSTGLQSQPSGDEHDISRIVLDYLNKRGFNRTEAMLRLEASKQGYNQSDPQLNLLLDHPRQYDHMYTILRDWINSSLDIYKVSVCVFF